MRFLAPDAPVEGFTDELLTLLLEEAERALLVVEARADEPGRRVQSGDVPEGEVVSEDISELRLAIAELSDAHPRISFDIEAVGDRLRNVGVRAASRQLEAHPELLDLVRLSLEVFFRLHPSQEAFEAEQRRLREGDPDPSTGSEVYGSYQQMSSILRARLS